MIAHIKGTVLSKEDQALIVDVGGLGYRIAVTDTINHKHPIGVPVALHLHYHLRENTAELYGFGESGELELFKLLLNVSGIGPKTALNVLNVCATDAIARAVGRGDASLLKQISGIGAKTAERIVMELKGKLRIGSVLPGAYDVGDGEIIDALVGLGYAHAAARTALDALDPSVEGIEDRLRQCLQYLGKGVR